MRIRSHIPGRAGATAAFPVGERDKEGALLPREEAAKLLVVALAHHRFLDHLGHGDVSGVIAHAYN